jgi:hypothetical protein
LTSRGQDQDKKQRNVNGAIDRAGHIFLWLVISLKYLTALGYAAIIAQKYCLGYHCLPLILTHRELL